MIWMLWVPIIQRASKWQIPGREMEQREDGIFKRNDVALNAETLAII